MKYTTRNEFKTFEFNEVHINDVILQNDVFKVGLDDVIILPENSHNRDIRKMRTNSFVLTIEGAIVLSFIEEGYKIYDADGNLMKTEEDILIDEQDYASVMENFIDANAYLIDKNNDEYSFVIDGTNERTYNLIIQGNSDVQEWDRFMNIE